MIELARLELHPKTFRLLLVDDELEVRDRWKGLLEGAGFAVTTAETGKKAAKAALEGRFDAVLVEYHLPDCRGTALVRWLHKRLPGLPVIVTSACAGWDMFFKARSIGAADVIPKALPARELFRTLRHSMVP